MNKIFRPKTKAQLFAMFKDFPDETPIGLTTLNLLGEIVPQTLEIEYDGKTLTVVAPSPDM